MILYKHEIGEINTSKHFGFLIHFYFGYLVYNLNAIAASRANVVCIKNG